VARPAGGGAGGRPGDAAAEWLGRRVVVPRVLPCGECERCRRGRAATCASRAPRAGLASHETVPARYLLSVEPPLWPERLALWQLAALADAAAAPYGALTRAGLSPGELVVVIGGGVRGTFAVSLVRAKGAHAVVVDADPLRRQRALDLGALAAFSPELAPSDLLAELARLPSDGGQPPAPDKILETTATAAGRLRALALIGPGATAALLDGGSDEEPLPGGAWERFALVEGQLFGASACHPDLLPELAALVVRGEVDPAPLVVAVPPTEIEGALAARRQGRLRELPVIVWPH
jgi:6-hydroxycyclohex-1-ene-1-carbonyl-CoA dehydrogenase